MKKIMLHGATDCGSSNYGDYLYGEIVYKYLKDKGYDVCFYNPSSFFVENLEGYKQQNLFNKKEADGILYIPGGYFGEGHDARFRDNFVQFLRFMPLGIWASYNRKKMGVLAIGAGPNKNLFMNFGIKRICKKSGFVTTRDYESYQALNKLVGSNNIKQCGDIIITQEYHNSVVDEQVNDILDKVNGKKIILVHYNHDRKALDLFAQSIKKFIEENNDFVVVVTADTIMNGNKELFDIFKNNVECNCFYYEYKTPTGLTSMIEHSDLIITSKLHLGVVGCVLNKSVIPVACHPEKTYRFYESINEQDRFLNLYNTSVDEIVNVLRNYKNKPIAIKPEIIGIASKSFEILDSWLKER